jgi:hypothetical protein
MDLKKITQLHLTEANESSEASREGRAAVGSRRKQHKFYIRGLVGRTV